MNVQQAITTVRTNQLAQEQVAEATELLLKEIVRYRKALEFYAQDTHYLDGAPMLGAFAQQDGGFTARQALRLDDFRGDALTPQEQEQVRSEAA